MRQYILRKSVGILPGLSFWTYMGLHYDLQVLRYGEVNSYIYAVLVSKYQKHEQKTSALPTLQLIGFRVKNPMEI
jgi:hypothetical protein